MHDGSILPDTIEALRKLSDDSRLRPQERATIEKEMREIEDFTSKLENGRLEIAAFGEVGSGKRALLSALAGENVFAVSAEHGSTDKIAKTGFKNTRLVLVDTPGINEAAGELRGKLAEDTLRYTDLVLFVADGDLNRVEVDAFNQLSDLHKPIVLIINKADLYGPAQIREISESVLRTSSSPPPRPGSASAKFTKPTVRSKSSATSLSRKLKLWKRGCWKSSTGKARRSSRSTPACSPRTSATGSGS